MKRKLYRSERDSSIAGVCGGLGEFLGIDSTVIRLAWVILTLIGGVGLPLYIIAAIIIPRRPTDNTDTSYETENQSMSTNSNNNSGLILGIILIILGGLILLNRILSFSILKMIFSYGWPVVLIIVGLVIIFNSSRR